MPAGTDLVVWSPCKGVAGDDRYDLDMNGDIRWRAGDASGFSSPPTLDQINASSHHAQILGYLNHRWRCAFDTGLFSGFAGQANLWKYAVSGDKGIPGNTSSTPDPSIVPSFKDIRTYIDIIRQREGLSVYSWPTDFPVAPASALFSRCPTEQHIFHIRKALATDHYTLGLSNVPASFTGISQSNHYTDGAYPPDPGGTFGAAGGAWGTFFNFTHALGQGNAKPSTDVYGCSRTIVSFKIPSYLSTFTLLAPALLNNALNMVNSGGGYVQYGMTLEAWLNGTYRTALDATAFADLGTKIASVALSSTFSSGAAPTGAKELFPSSGLIASSFAPNTNYSVLLLSGEERANTNQGGSAKWESWARFNNTQMCIQAYL